MKIQFPPRFSWCVVDLNLGFLGEIEILRKRFVNGISASVTKTVIAELAETQFGVFGVYCIVMSPLMAQALFQ